MGQSADAILAIGVDLGGDDEMPEEFEDFDWHSALDGRDDDLKDHVDFESYGHFDFGAWALVVKRTVTTAYEYGCAAVDQDTLAELTEGEKMALEAALDHIEWTGDRTVRLLLMADYG